MTLSMEEEATENIPSGIGIFDVTAQSIDMKYINDGFYRMIGGHREDRTQFFGAGTINSVHPDDRPGLVAEARAAIEEGREFEYQFRNLDGSGKYIWIGIRASHRSLDKDTERFYASYYNVDRFVNEQNRLEAQGDALDAILGNIPGGAALFSEKHGEIRIEYANSGFYRLHHGSMEYWSKQSKNPVDWLTSSDRHIFEEEFDDVNSGRKDQGDVTYRITGEDGNPYWVCNQFRPAYKKDGIRYYYASFIDMDGQVAAEQQIRQSKQIYDDATKMAKTVVWTYDIDRHQASIMQGGYSSEICKRYGIPEFLEGFPESLGHFAIAWDEKPILDAFRSIDEGAQSAEAEFWFQMPDQATRQWEHVVLKRIDDENGHATISCCGQNVTTRIQAQQEYDESLRNMLLDVPDALDALHVDLTDNTCDWSHGVSVSNHGKVLPATVDGLIDRLSSEVPDESQRDSLHVFDRQALLSSFNDGKGSVSLRYRRLGTDGSLCWVSTSIHMLANPDSGHVEGAAYTLDISKEMRQNEIFQIITSRSFDLVALIHLKSRVFEAVYLGESLPAAYRRLLPRNGAECSFDAFCSESTLHMDPDTRKEYESRISSEYIRHQLEQSGGSYEFMLKEHFADTKRGFMYRRFLHYTLSDDSDTVLVIESDATEETLRQNELLEKMQTEAERDRKIMDSIKIGIAELRFSKSGRLTVDSFNQQMFRMLGYDPAGLPQRAEDAQGTPLEAAFGDALLYVHPDDKAEVLSAFEKHYGDESFSIGPYRMRKSDGAFCQISEDVQLHERGDEFQTYYATYRDVTWELGMRVELKQRLEDEQALREKADAANAAKSEFLSRMSHDMRTPLNGVIGMTYLAKEQENPPRTAECLSKIDVSAKFLLGLINDVLDMTKVESGKVEQHLEPYTIGEFNNYLDAVIRPLCEEKDLKFVFDWNVTMNTAPLVDKSCINQVLFNLLSNAVKYTPAGGTITYQIYGKQISANRVAIEHVISDTGIGMSKEFQEKLFEPFTQEFRDDSSESRGSGLGLAIVKRLVDLMGGSISIDSRLGQGTKATLRFEFDSVPMETSQTPMDAKLEGEQEADLSGLHVLLCEDHPINQEIAKSLLEMAGATVDVAVNGQVGLDTFKNSALGSYDAILMDIRMPIMDGYETARAIRALERPDAKSVAIIAMTADAFSDDVRKCLDAGMDGHIAKPVEPEILYEKVAAAARQGH